MTNLLSLTGILPILVLAPLLASSEAAFADECSSPTSVQVLVLAKNVPAAAIAPVFNVTLENSATEERVVRTAIPGNGTTLAFMGSHSPGPWTVQVALAGVPIHSTSVEFECGQPATLVSSVIDFTGVPISPLDQISDEEWRQITENVERDFFDLVGRNNGFPAGAPSITINCPSGATDFSACRIGEGSSTEIPTTYSCPGGTLSTGARITGDPDQVICGTNYKTWKCTASGWTSLGVSCSGTAPVGSTASLLQVTVLDNATSAPITGALVKVGPYALSTDTRGVVSGTVPHGTYSGSVQAKGYVAYRTNFSHRAPRKLTVRLNRVVAPPTASLLQVTVLDNATSAPIVGASVQVGSFLNYTNASGVVSGTVPHGTYSASVQRSGYVAYSTSFNHQAPQNLTVRLNPVVAPPTASLLQVTVLDNATGAPIVGASVQVGSYALTTNAEGVVSGTVPHGTYSASVQRSGYVAYSTSLNHQAPQSLTVRLSPVVALPTASLLQVTVLDNATSAPIVGASVQVGSYALTTNTGGVVSDTIPHGTYSASIQRSGYVAYSTSLNHQAPQSLTVRLSPVVALPTASLLQVTVLDNATSAPIVGASVQVGSYALTTNTEGVVSGTVPHGTYSGSVQASGYVAYSSSFNHQAPQNLTVRLNRVVAPAPTAGTLRICYTYAGAPVQGVIIQATAGTFVTGANGCAEAYAPFGYYPLSASYPAWGWSESATVSHFSNPTVILRNF